MLKRSEHKLAKRAQYVFLERKNLEAKNFKGQEVIEARSAECASAGSYRGSSSSSSPFSRCYRGHCVIDKDSGRHRYNINCNIPPRPVSARFTSTSRSCEEDQECVTIEAFNYAGKLRPFPYCQNTFQINKKPALSIEAPPRFEGWLNIPPKPNDEWPMHEDLPSPGTLDSYYQLEGQYSGHTASWEYRGHWSNGWAFLVSSLVMASSFSCLGCPSGTLYAETVGFKSKAVGFTLPHVI